MNKLLSSKYITILFLILFFNIYFVASTNAQIYTKEILTAATSPKNAAISGNRVVWQDSRHGNSDIFMYDLSTATTTEIVINTSSQEEPDIDGNIVVWSDERDGNTEIYMYNISTSIETRITNDSVNQATPVISGNIIVWSVNNGGYNNIIMYNISTEVQVPIASSTFDERQPSIDGNKIAYISDVSGNSDVYTYDTDTGITSRITTNSSSQLYPDVSSSKIVWLDYRDGNDVYMYNISTGLTSRITPDSDRKTSPGISGNKIIWEESGDIYIYDINTATSTLAIQDGTNDYSAIDGDNLVFADSSGVYIARSSAGDAPTGLSQTAGIGTSVTLDWNNNTENDFSYYNIYRSTSAGVALTSGNKVNTENITSSMFVDSITTPWTCYYYTATAVNTGGAESSAATELQVCSNKTIANGTVSSCCEITCDKGCRQNGNSCAVAGGTPMHFLLQSKDICEKKDKQSQISRTTSNGSNILEEIINEYSRNFESCILDQRTSKSIITLSKDYQSGQNNFIDDQKVVLDIAGISQINQVALTVGKENLDILASNSNPDGEIEISISNRKSNTEQQDSEMFLSGFDIFEVKVLVDSNEIKQFNFPLTLTFDVSGVENVEKLGIYYFDESLKKWVQVKDEIKLINSQLIFEFNHLTIFTLMPATQIIIKEEEVVVGKDSGPIKDQDEKDEQLNQILEEANIILKSGNDLDQIIMHNNAVKDVEKQTFGMENYAMPIVGDNSGLTINQIYQINNFIVYGTKITSNLGAGERAGVISSYKKAFKKVPVTSEEWRDAVAISSGRWPNETNKEAEDKAKDEFNKVYNRSANMNNPNDNAAVTIMAYGLRPKDRNMNSEAVAIDSFKYIYNYHPVSALDWDIVRAIAYSGATRESSTIDKVIEETPICKISEEFSQYLVLGSRSEQVKNLQLLLKCLGYFSQNTEPTTYYWYATRNALREFQADNNITITGTVGPTTREVLNKYFKEEDEDKEICTIDREFDQILIGGSYEQDVYRLQELLKCLGYYPKDIESTIYFDNVTYSSLLKFQSDNGILRTGEVEPETMQVLNKYVLGVEAEKNTQEKEEDAIKTTKVEQKEEDKQVCTIDREFDQILIGGAYEQDVYRLQELLKCLGYYPKDIESTIYFDNVTYNSLIKFQSDNEILKTGEVDPKTLEVLNRHISV